MNPKEHQKVLTEMVEKILFDEVELQRLKTLINEVSAGRTDPKQLKATILNSRANMLGRILNIFPFYIKRIESRREIEQFSGTGANVKFQRDLEDKNSFLQLIGEKLKELELKLSLKSSI